MRWKFEKELDRVKTEKGISPEEDRIDDDLYATYSHNRIAYADQLQRFKCTRKIWI